MAKIQSKQEECVYQIFWQNSSNFALLNGSIGGAMHAAASKKDSAMVYKRAGVKFALAINVNKCPVGDRDLKNSCYFSPS